MTIRLLTLSLLLPSYQNPNLKSPKEIPNLPLFSLKTHSTTTSDSGLLFRQKLLYLQTLKIDPHKALHQNPNLRSTPLSSLKSTESCLLSMGLDRSSLGRILDMLPSLLTSDPDAHLYPIFDFLLNEVQIPFPDIRKCIIRCPRILTCSVSNQLRPSFSFLKEFGFVGQHAINCNTTLLLVSSVENTLLPKIEYLIDLGFKYGEVVRMVLRSPGLLTFSIENNFRPKVVYFLEDMKGDLRELKRFPQYFSFSLEGKIKPRHRKLVENGFSMLLSDMLKISDGEFNVRLVEMRLLSVEGR